MAQLQTWELIAEIESYEQTYYISEDGRIGKAASDEALIEIHGRIVHIPRRYRQHLNQPIEITFGCAMSYAIDERTTGGGRPFLLPINLSKARRGFMAYLPSAAFWAIPDMIAANRLTHVQAQFEQPRHGSGNLLGVYLMPKAKFGSLLAQSS